MTHRVRNLIWLWVVVACGHHDRAPIANASGAGLPALPGGGDRAYVSGPGGLVEVSPTAAQPIAKDVAWCNVDARAQVVWFVTDAGLSAFDLVDRQIHPVIHHALAAHSADGAETGELEVIVDWGNQRLGGEDAVAFDVGIALHMQAAPALEMVMGCDGDRAVYCFDEKQQPVPNVVALQQLAKQLRFDDAPYMATLAARGAPRFLWTPPPVPPQPPKPPAVDRARCHEQPERCGTLTAIPGSALWLVETENSRGDYYHQTRELWDPATGEFVRVHDGALVRTKQPPSIDDAGDVDYGGLRVSPSGLMSIDGVVFDPTKVRYAPKDTGHTCGFASGGWRIPGARG